MGSSQAPDRDEVLARKYAAWKKAKATPEELAQLVAQYDSANGTPPAPAEPTAPSAPPLAPNLPTVAGMSFGRLSALGQGILRGAAALQVKPTTETAPDPMSKVPPEWQQQGQQQQIALEAQYPGTSQAGRLAGLLVSPANKVFEGGAGLLAAGKYGKAILSGGASTAAVTAANRPEGTSFGQDVADVGVSALLGGGLAGAFAAAPGAYNWAKTAIGNKRDPSLIAGRILREANTNDMVDLARRAETAPPDAVVADIAGPGMAANIREAIATPSQEATLTRKMLERRADVGRGALAKRLASATGVEPQAGNIAAKTDISETLRPGIRAKYDEIMNAHNTLTDPRIQAQLTSPNPIMQTAVAAAKEVMAEAGTPILEGMNGPKMVGLRFFDEVKRGLDAQLRTSDKAEAMRVKAVLGPYRRTLDEVTKGTYKIARDLDTERRAYLEATDLGAKYAAGTADPRDWQIPLREMFQQKRIPDAIQENARVAFREGAARALLNRVNNAGSDEAALEALAKTPNAEARARLAFPTQDAYETFVRKSREVLRPVVIARAYAGNAKAVEIMDHDILSRMTPWSIAQALSGQPTLLAAQYASGVSKAMQGKAAIAASPLIAKAARTALSRATQGGAREMTPEFQQFLAWLQRSHTPPPPMNVPIGLSSAPGILGAGLLNR